MAVDFFIPNMGENVKEVTIVNWLVEDGARVDVDQDILEVETDKATVPIPANGEGYIHLGPYKAGDVVEVDMVVATIGPKGGTFTPGEDSADEAETGKQVEPVKTAPRSEAAQDKGIQPPVVSAGKPKATPVAQKMAADLGVDLNVINGSGEHGKITKQDILQASSREAPQKAPAKEPEQVAEAAPQAEKEPAAESAPTNGKGPAVPTLERRFEQPLPASFAGPTPEDQILETVPLKGIRGVIARRMDESVHTTARVTLTTDVDVTEFVALRADLKAKYTDEWGFAPGYNDLLALIVATGLREFPYMNARLAADGQSIQYLKPINMGMAVDTERGLLVVVIRDTDKKGLQQFGAEFRELAGKARAGKASPTELSGGTFTITSLGIYRVEAFTPVINLPEVAILGVGRIMPKPVVRNNDIVIRQMMTLSLVFDHRLTDGAPAARFLDYICDLIEDPSLLFMAKR
jgi:pyruvate dehydrogenase E2 component (dihydrolipoamide acetyltransferase)